MTKIYHSDPDQIRCSELTFRPCHENVMHTCCRPPTRPPACRPSVRRTHRRVLYTYASAFFGRPAAVPHCQRGQHWSALMDVAERLRSSHSQRNRSRTASTPRWNAAAVGVGDCSEMPTGRGSCLGYGAAPPPTMTTATVIQFPGRRNDLRPTDTPVPGVGMSRRQMSTCYQQTSLPARQETTTSGWWPLPPRRPFVGRLNASSSRTKGHSSRIRTYSRPNWAVRLGGLRTPEVSRCHVHTAANRRR
jgi:hypothetical protein